MVAFKFLLGLKLLDPTKERSSVLIVKGEEDDKSPAPRDDTEPRNSRSDRSTRRRELELKADPLKMKGTKRVRVNRGRIFGVCSGSIEIGVSACNGYRLARKLSQSDTWNETNTGGTRLS